MRNKNMKAIVIYEAGGPEKLVYTEVPVPEVKPGWSLVRIIGRGVNHSEIFTRDGQSPSVTFPRILGIEGVGMIAESTDPIRLPAGEKVISIMGEMGRAFDGSYAEYALLPNNQIYPVTTDLPWEILAALPETYYTAYGSMKNLRITEGSKILVRGGTSGVGIAFVRLVKSGFKDVQVTGTTRNLRKAGALLDEGFDQVVEDRDQVLQTEERYDRIFDLIGPAALLIPVTGLGRTSAVIVLTLYNQYLLLRNFTTGQREADPVACEAAKGIGMTDMQILTRIRIPLARKAIFAGIRLAIVSTVGIATIAASINAEGLGILLFEGLRTMNIPKILWGSVLSAGMAVLLNAVLKMVEEKM